MAYFRGHLVLNFVFFYDENNIAVFFNLFTAAEP